MTPTETGEAACGIAGTKSSPVWTRTRPPSSCQRHVHLPILLTLILTMLLDGDDDDGDHENDDFALHQVLCKDKASTNSDERQQKGAGGGGGSSGDDDDAAIASTQFTLTLSSLSS